MCDTLVALGNVTADGVTILGKNSDREPNEAHHLLRIPSARHAPDGKQMAFQSNRGGALNIHDMDVLGGSWIDDSAAIRNG